MPGVEPRTHQSLPCRMYQLRRGHPFPPFWIFVFCHHQCDRNALSSSFSRGGGVLIAVRAEFDSNIIPITNRNVKHIFVKFTYNDSIQLVINDNPNSLFLFCGDFNQPDIAWSNDNLGLTYSSTSDIRINCLPETFAFLNYYQLNKVLNTNGKLLDLVF
ncbi:RNA-directed DNA polymerase from mobile element jockey, partial [Aphis craccivora]